MNPLNMRDLLDDWENRELLYRIKKEVSAEYELGAVVKSMKGEQPFLFDNVKGYTVPMAAGLGGSRKLMADSIGLDESELIPKMIDSIINPIPTNSVPTAPVHENVVMGPFDLDDFFPIPTFHTEDCAPYYVSGVLVVKDPEGKKRYTSIRRMKFIGGNRTNIVITSPELARQYADMEKKGEAMEIAVMFGVVPAIVLASQYSTHLYHTDKFNVAGALLGQALDVVQCKTVDLEVLAEAEIVLEGKILPNERDEEGLFGELGGYYGGNMPQPIVEMSAITYRDDPISQTIFPSSSEEKLPMSLVREMTLFSTIRQVVENVKAVHITMAAAARLHAVIQIEKKSEGDAKQAAMAAFASDKDLKHVVVVDDDVDIFDSEDVEWAIATRCQADQDIFIIAGAKGSPLESSHNLRGVSAKMGIDATYPLSEKELFTRTSVPIQKINLKDYL
ncbi:3-octaprenyl-4-hydroxybenzoate carboxy-lyase [Virgibacillus profundi]|uniref:3-octaprenyl-4-hydroxybenzoate carboxy-lyase n=1 Tax=Virgibacillus profundi TaxID=2024555 RepID=A0A2A2ICK3_9BACI|nr:UbiD family decarboxylase [Virgibacillus profundi]PAV29741.1 3-octaprenyl-4-hydroxybenzoate carboxy-lyase [Virgibacillus profundi]PXY53913.1 UbiD family decarboxylase [Virgibacillus profundi]